MPTKQSNASGGCLALFALPFVIVGSSFVFIGLRQTHDPHFRNAWLFPVIGGVAVFFGLLVFISGLVQSKSAQRGAAAQAAFADQPWMLREDWRQGRAQGLSGGSARGTWIFAVFWNAMCFGMFYLVMAQTPHKLPFPLYLFFSVFAAIGLAALLAALRQSLRLARFGRTFVQLQTLPAPLGRTLKGTIEARLPYPLPHGINLSLACINRVTTNTGKNRSTTDYIRWRANQSLRPEQIMAGPAGCTIPIDFEVPRDMSPSSHANPNDRILWMLRAEADIPGVNFDEKYEVPVFETPDSPSLQAWEATQEAEERAHPPTVPVRPTVRVSAAPEGGTAFYFPPGRNLGPALAITLFAAIFTAAEVALVMFHGPFLFMVIFGLVSLLLVALTANAWFGTARLVASARGITVTSNTLGYSTSRSWTPAQLRSIHPKITGQSGSGISSTVYYRVTVTDIAGREQAVGNDLRDHNEAEWLCEQIRQSAHIQAQAAGAAG